MRWLTNDCTHLSHQRVPAAAPLLLLLLRVYYSSLTKYAPCPPNYGPSPVMGLLLLPL